MNLLIITEEAHKLTIAELKNLIQTNKNSRIEFNCIKPKDLGLEPNFCREYNIHVTYIRPLYNFLDFKYYFHNLFQEHHQELKIIAKPWLRYYLQYLKKSQTTKHPTI